MYSADLIRKNTNKLIKFCLKKENIELKESNLEEYKQLVMRTYPKFHYNYPTLFFMIIENPDKFDNDRFNDLIENKKKIERNETTLDEASKKIGEEYYNEFVKPNIESGSDI